MLDAYCDQYNTEIYCIYNAFVINGGFQLWLNSNIFSELSWWLLRCFNDCTTKIHFFYHELWPLCYLFEKEGISNCISGAGMMMLEKRSFIQSLQMEYLPVVCMDANVWIVLHRMRNERKKNNPKMYVPKIKTTTISR